jgi:hypothetical protein
VDSTLAVIFAGLLHLEELRVLVTTIPRVPVNDDLTVRAGEPDFIVVVASRPYHAVSCWTGRQTPVA